MARTLPEREVGRGWYQGQNTIMPFDPRPILMVAARQARRLHGSSPGFLMVWAQTLPLALRLCY